MKVKWVFVSDFLICIFNAFLSHYFFLSYLDFFPENLNTIRVVKSEQFDEDIDIIKEIAEI